MSYSRIIEEKGDSVYYSINNRLTDYFELTELEAQNVIPVLTELKNIFSNNEINDTYTYFCIDPDNNITTLGYNNLPDFTVKFYIPKMIEINENRIYGLSKEDQGIIETINSENGKYV
jgi:hypothetical protein